MKFEFEGFNICEVGQEQRRMQTSKKVNNILTEVRVFRATRGSISFELLHCTGSNGDTWVVAENVVAESEHLHRAQRTRMSIEKFENQQYCRLWQEVKKDKDWSQTKKRLPLSEIGKYSQTPVRSFFTALGAKLGTLEELVSETNMNRKQFGVLFYSENLQVPLCVYLLTRVLPLI